MKKSVCAVIGASGFLGRETVSAMAQTFHIVPTSQRVRPGYYTLDIRNPHDVQSFVEKVKPDAVVLLAAYRDPDECETHPVETRQLNVAPASFFMDALPTDVPLLFVSTDYVFAGDDPPYEIDAERRPLSVYGQTKKEAEDIVSQRPSNIILRVPLLMGWTDQLETSGFLTQLLGDLRCPTSLTLDDVLARYPVWTREVGLAIQRLLVDGQRGVFHFSTTRKLTRYKAACEMGDLLGWPTDHLQPSHVIVPRKAQRPVDAQLSIERWRSCGYAPPSDFRVVAQQFIDHFGIK